jgi:uncharacterized membrane protein YhaH (DUF805 family)
MDFKTAVTTCLVKKYANFNGRASRSEFWWFYLACFVINSVVNIVAQAIGDAGSILSLIACLALLIPSLAAGCRRLHDINKTGWIQLVGLIPLIGIIILIVLWIKEPVEPNNYQ